MAQTLVDDVDANPPASLDDVEPQDYLAFWVNPKAEALRSATIISFDLPCDLLVVLA